MTIPCDVLVAGAGTAGVPAALAASRAGLRTLLVERSRCPGGTAIAGMHRFICGLYANSPGRPLLLHGDGIVRDIIGGIQDFSGSDAPVPRGTVTVLPFSPTHLEAAYARLMQKEPELEVRFRCCARSVARNGNRITAVLIESMEGVLEVEPAFVIDCTGDGVIVNLSGAPRIQPSPPGRRQLSGFTIQFAGLVDANDMLSVEVPYRLAKGARGGALPPHLRFTTFTPGAEPGMGTCKLALPAFPPQSRDQRAMEDAARVHRFLRSALAAFRDSTIAATSPHVLDREGLRLLGEYVLSEDDVVNGRHFPDGTVRNAWPIEFWDPKTGPCYRPLAPGRPYYEIPTRCLRSATVDNLICAGRCISVSARALASTRVMGTCMASGEAAGRLAAEAL